MAKKTISPTTITTRRRVKPAATAAASDSSHGSNGNAAKAPSPEDIAEAAYHRYLSRGGHDGADFDDWVEAERELRSRSR